MSRKIYRSITIDMATGKTLAEDSYMYDGLMCLCEGAEEGGGDGKQGGDGGDEGKDPQITLGDILPEELRGDKLPGSLKDFAGVQIPGKDADEESVKTFHGKLSSLAKSYADTKHMVGGMIKVPGKDAKPEEIAAFRQKIGIPEKPEDYKIEKPTLDGDKAVFSDELLGSFVKVAHDEGFTPLQVQAAVNFQAEMVKNQIKALDKAAAEGIAALQKEYGDEYESLVQGAELVVAKYFPEETRDKFKIGLGNDPEFVKGMIAIYRATKEDGDIKGLKSGGHNDNTVEAMQSEIDKLMSSQEYINGDKPTHEKVQKLFVDKQKVLGTYKDNVRSSKVEV